MNRVILMDVANYKYIQDRRRFLQILLILFSEFSPSSPQNFISYDNERIFQNYCQTVKTSVATRNWIANSPRVLIFCL
jgi:hypothetical protein